MFPPGLYVFAHQEEEDQPYVTRQQQLDMKPDKSEGRGRGRGRGTGGRGRGRGSQAAPTNKKEKGDDNQSAKRKKGKNAKQDQADDEDWYGEGYVDEEWGYQGGKEQWDQYALACSSTALDELRQDEDKKDRKGRKHTGKEEKEASASSKTKQPKASKPPGKKQVQQEAEEAEEATKTERKKRKPEHQEAGESQKISTEKKGKKAQKTDQQQDAAQHSQHYMDPPPKKVRKIQNFVALYWDDAKTAVATQDIKDDMRSRLKEIKACRLNIYWKTSACGCTYKETSKDVAHFFFGKNMGSYMTRLAMAVKCAEMFVTWVHEV